MELEVVRLVRTLVARRSPERPGPDAIVLHPALTFMVIGRYRGRLDLRLLCGAGHDRRVEYCVLHVPTKLVEPAESPNDPGTRPCPMCGHERQHTCFRRGRSECSVCASKKRKSRGYERRTPSRRMAGKGSESR